MQKRIHWHEAARPYSPEDDEATTRRFRRPKCNEALDAENERHECRRVAWRMDEDGCWSLHARFTPEQGEHIMKAIDAAVDEIEAEQRDVSAETSSEFSLQQVSSRRTCR